MALRDRIVTLDLAPGSAIDEEQLVSELGIGRTPLRAAIARLALEGLIVVFPRRGTFVAEINMTDLTHISEFRRRIEGFAAFEAARAAPEDRESVAGLLDELERGATELDTGGLMALDRRVHEHIYALSGNPLLARTADQYYNLAVRIWYLVLKRLPHLDETVAEHRRLLQAILAGESKQAEELAQSHVAKFAEMIRGAF